MELISWDWANQLQFYNCKILNNTSGMPNEKTPYFNFKNAYEYKKRSWIKRSRSIGPWQFECSSVLKEYGFNITLNWNLTTYNVRHSFMWSQTVMTKTKLRLSIETVYCIEGLHWEHINTDTWYKISRYEDYQFSWMFLSKAIETVYCIYLYQEISITWYSNI